MTTVSQATLDQRTIPAEAFVPCKQAFIDCRTPGSDKKENYSMIGPGVTQSDDQFVNLAQPHGFNIGGAGMPKGCVNNLHIHFTAEVFYVYKGEWEFRWGNNGEHTVTLKRGTVFSPRTWLFRGFRNVGVDDGFLFTMLGEDDTGGIIWHPKVLREAEQHGLVLTAKNKVLDTKADPSLKAEAASAELINPMTEAEMQTLRQPGVEEMKRRVVEFESLEWSKSALLCSKTQGGGCELAPVIGWGMTEEREHTPKIYNPHGFSVEWLKIPVGQAVGRHRIKEAQVLKVGSGVVEVSLNRPEEGVAKQSLAAKGVVSIPKGAWRCFTNCGDEDAYVLVINGGDAPNRIEWSEAVVAEAKTAGFGLDKSGYLALQSLIKYSQPMSPQETKAV